MQSDWNDLRYVLAIARGAGLNGAARLLNVNISSVYRRLQALEEKMQVQLFERKRDNYRLTPAGEVLAESAARIESEALAAERRVHGTDGKLEGHLRISTGEAVAFFLLPPYLAAFREAYPDITLEIGVTNALVDLARRDADVVIRDSARPPEFLVGRNAGPIAFAAYASRRYLDSHGRGRALAGHEWLGFDGGLSRLRQSMKIAAHIPQDAIRLRFDSFGALHAAVLSGLGCAVLPCFACDGDPRLARLPGTYEQTTLQLWVLTHPDLRRSARVRAFLNFFGTRLQRAGDRLNGRAEALAPAASTRVAEGSPAC